jgi:DNA-binding transcriptional LysR family regulator
MSLDPRHVSVFRAVVRHGTFSGAARELGYSQPAVSQQMRALEKSLGTPIFVRGGRRLLLTEAGVLLREHADPILDGMARAEARIRSVVEMRTGRVRIGAFPSASATLVPDAVTQVLAEHPSVRIELLEAEPPESFELLRDGACDVLLAFSYDQDADGATDGLLEVPLVADELVVLARAGHRLADGGPITLADLADEHWITGCPRCSQHFRALCADAGFEPDVVCAIDDNLSVQSLVASGLGVAMMPELVVSFMRHDDVTRLPLTTSIARRVSAYVWPDSRDVPVVRAVLEALQRTAPGYR